MNSSDFLIQLEAKGINAMNSNDYQIAIQCFEKIIDVMPDYEHGMIYYNLACCLEDIGEYEKARFAYEKSLFYYPEDPIRLGGYASFLYLRGSLEESFDAYLKLSSIEAQKGSKSSIDNCLQMLIFIGSKLGWKEEQVLEALKKKSS